MSGLVRILINYQDTIETFGIGYNYELDWYWDTVWNQHCGRKDNGCGYTGYVKLIVGKKRNF